MEAEKSNIKGLKSDKCFLLVPSLVEGKKVRDA
jgi:hypothetical protein